VLLRLDGLLSSWRGSAVGGAGLKAGLGAELGEFVAVGVGLVFGAFGPGAQVLPDTENSDVGGVHDADGEPGISGGVVGEVPGYVGTVPD
jgi:hypothetical protein